MGAQEMRSSTSLSRADRLRRRGLTGRHLWWFSALVVSLAAAASLATAATPKPQRQPRPSRIANLGALADPGALTVGGQHYVYATSAHGVRVPEAVSGDLVRWRWLTNPDGSLHDALANRGAWATAKGGVWAPGVQRSAGGTYVMYYSARSKSGGKPARSKSGGKVCIGVATAPAATATFVASRDPIVCRQPGPPTDGGAIDASVFVDVDRAHTQYLLWKNDGNSTCRTRCHPTSIWIQRLSGDGLGLLGRPAKLLTNRPSLEGRIVEAPILRRHGSHYVLFYSANYYNTARYSVRYATSRMLVARYRRGNGALLTTRLMHRARLNAAGPGGQDVVTDASAQAHIVFAAHVVNRGGSLGEREMWVARLNWSRDDAPHVRGL